MHSSISNSNQRRELKNFAIGALKFGGIFVVLLVVLNIFLVVFRWDHREHLFEEVRNPEVKAEIVIFGSSVSAVGIDPRYLEPLGYRTYNFSLMAATPDYFLPFYNQILRDYYPKPKLVIYQTDCLLFDDYQSLGRSFLGDCEFFPLRFYLKCLMNPNNSKLFLLQMRFAIFKARDESRSWFTMRSEFLKAATHGYHGYVPLLRNGAKEDLKKEFNPVIDEYGLVCFEALLDRLQKDGIPVIIVQNPAYLPGMVVNDDMRKHNGRIETIAKKRGLIFLNYNGERISHFNESPEYFAKATHLNLDGATEFSKRLCSDLSKVLPQQLDRLGKERMHTNGMPRAKVEAHADPGH